jgi:hypothetical protein
MTDPTQMPGQPSQEEMRAYLEQLRAADPVGLLAEAFNLLATGAQVKLGRPDARVLIDAMAGMVHAAGARIPGEVAQQMNEGIAQLQMAQVQAEKDAGAEGADQGAEAEGDDASGAAPPPGAAPQPGAPSGPGGPGQQKMTDRLWVPGRDPKPPGAR